MEFNTSRGVIVSTSAPHNGTDIVVGEVQIGTVIIILWATGGLLLMSLIGLLVCILKTNKKTRDANRQSRDRARGGPFRISDNCHGSSRTGGINPAFTNYDEIWTWIPVVRGNQDECQQQQQQQQQQQARREPISMSNGTYRQISEELNRTLEPPPYSVAITTPSYPPPTIVSAPSGGTQLTGIPVSTSDVTTHSSSNTQNLTSSNITATRASASISASSNSQPRSSPPVIHRTIRTECAIENRPPDLPTSPINSTRDGYALSPAHNTEQKDHVNSNGTTPEVTNTHNNPLPESLDLGFVDDDSLVELTESDREYFTRGCRQRNPIHLSKNLDVYFPKQNSVNLCENFSNLSERQDKTNLGDHVTRITISKSIAGDKTWDVRDPWRSRDRGHDPDLISQLRHNLTEGRFIPISIDEEIVSDDVRSPHPSRKVNVMNSVSSANNNQILNPCVLGASNPSVLGACNPSDLGVCNPSVLGACSSDYQTVDEIQNKTESPRIVRRLHPHINESPRMTHVPCTHELNIQENSKQSNEAQCRNEHAQQLGRQFDYDEDNGMYSFTTEDGGRRVWCDIPPSLLGEEGPPPYVLTADYSPRRSRPSPARRSNHSNRHSSNDHDRQAPLVRLEYDYF